jgi:replicative DNA helicase
VLVEQVLLGFLLTDNEYLNLIGDFLSAEHFFEQVHKRIYSSIELFIDRGITANPVTLKSFFDKDQALASVGGGVYLGKLASLATNVINVREYALLVYDLAMRRQLINIGEDIVNDGYGSDTGFDMLSSQQIEKAEQRLFNLSSEGNRGEYNFAHIKKSILETLTKAELAYKNKDKISGISTGFIDLDKILGGLQKSDLLVIAGRPSMGKTALAINMALNSCYDMLKSAEAPLSVGFFSLEMSAEQLAARLIAMMARTSASRIRSGSIDSNEFSDIVEASQQLQTLPFYIDDTPALSIASLRTRARRLKRRHNIGLLFVDYLQLIRASYNNPNNNRVNEVSEVTQGLKAIAKELNIPVVALSQLSRAVEQREDKRPQLSDLRESGSIEQDADVVMFIYREEYYVARKQPLSTSDSYNKWMAEMDRVRNITEIMVAKQRNGPIGNVKLHFEGETNRFSNLDIHDNRTSQFSA